MPIKMTLCHNLSIKTILLLWMGGAYSFSIMHPSRPFKVIQQPSHGGPRPPADSSATTDTGRPSTPLLSLSSTSTRLFQSRDWIDEVRDDELMDANDHQVHVKPDMKYLPRNVMRQHQNFVAIRQAGGPELTNDVYVREPNNNHNDENHESTFWFVGKVARISDVTPQQAIQRQWNLIETHAANLRPIELFPHRGSLEIWMAPGDSEMDVAYNQPHVPFERQERPDKEPATIKSNLVGFQGEMYEGGEQGFRTWRNAKDGSPARPEVSSPSTNDSGEEELRAPTDREMKDISSMLEGKDINEVYKEQQRRAGKPVDD